MVGQSDTAYRMVSNQSRQENGASENPKWTPSQTNGKDEKCHAASTVHERDRVLYKLDDVPPWYLTLLFGFQVTLENGDRLSAIWANTAHV